MDDRAKIPGLALLSLSFTTCVAEAPSEPDTIVGEWHAVNIDGDKFPMISGEAPYFQQNGVEMSIDAKLRGQLVNVQEVYYDGYQSRAESGSTLVAEQTSGVKYRIDIKRDPFSHHGYDEGYNDGYYDEGYADGYDVGYNPTGYGSYGSSVGDTDATSDGTAGETSGTSTGGSTTSGDGTSGTGGTGGTSGTDSTGGGSSTGGVIGEPGAVGAGRPLQIPVPGNFAPAAMVLKCTLDQDTLTCERDGGEGPQHWVFRRTLPPDPAGAK